MKRTTAGINYFRVHSSSTEETEEDSADAPATARSAKSILTEITDDNAKPRMGGEDVQEKTFDVCIEKDLIPMCKNTNLVFVDVPGINEANVVNKYTNYVAQHWENFDCVVVVMDSRQGVNTEEQVFLLNFVKEQLKKKDVPVIVLCNKVDDTKDEEQAELVKEARKEVEKIFETSCRKEALEKILTTSEKTTIDEKLSPAFIPVSAIHAFIHQSASLMDREAFENFDSDLLEKLGREQIGRHRWNRLSESEKRDEAFKVIKEGYQDGIKDSNFDKLLRVLDHFLGGEEAQQNVIEQQMCNALKSISTKRPFPPGGLTSLVRGFYEQRKLLHASNGTIPKSIKGFDLVDSFWSTYQAFETETFEKFKANFPKGFDALAELMNDLVRYHELAYSPDWNDTSERVIAKMEELIQRYITALINLQKKDKDMDRWDSEGKVSTITLTKGKKSGMTPHDWAIVWGSLLLLSYSRTFVEYFGQEKIIFERLAQDAHHWNNEVNKSTCDCGCTLYPVSGSKSSKWCKDSCYTVYTVETEKPIYCPYQCGRRLDSSHYCEDCDQTYPHVPFDYIPLAPCYDDKGRLLPFESKASAGNPLIITPKSFSDPTHIAHILWKFCDLIESLETKKHACTNSQAKEVIALSDDKSMEDVAIVSASSLTSDISSGDNNKDAKRRKVIEHEVAPTKGD